MLQSKIADFFLKQTYSKKRNKEKTNISFNLYLKHLAAMLASILQRTEKFNGAMYYAIFKN